MQRRIAAEAAGYGLIVAATACAFAAWCWWQATRPIRWDNLRDGVKR